MQTIRIYIVALALAASAAVHADTAKPAPAPVKPAPTEPSQADLEKFLVFMDKLADVVVADKADCAKMAGDVNKLIDANSELLEMAKKAAGDHKMPPAARNRAMASMKRMGAAMVEKCSKDADVQTAFKRLPGRPQQK